MHKVIQDTNLLSFSDEAFSNVGMYTFTNGYLYMLLERRDIFTEKKYIQSWIIKAFLILKHLGRKKIGAC